MWLPSKHVETSTLAAYRSYLDKHFIPTFGRRPMGKILPSEVHEGEPGDLQPGLDRLLAQCLEQERLPGP